MSVAIPGLGQILSSHSASGVSASPSAAQISPRPLKNVHPGATQLAGHTRFAEAFAAAQPTGAANSTAAPLMPLPPLTPP